MMMSIRANIAYCFQKDENGNEIRVWEYNADDRWISPNYDMPIYCAYGGIESCDAVAEGALTEAMFSKPATETDFMTKIVAALKAAIGITKKGPDDIDGDTNHATQDFSNNDIEMTKEEMQEMLDAQASNIQTQFSAKVDELQAQFAAKVTALEDEKATTEAATTDIAQQLEAAKAEVARLSLEAAADHSGGVTDTGKGKVSMGANHEWLKSKFDLP